MPSFPELPKQQFDREISQNDESGLATETPHDRSASVELVDATEPTGSTQIIPGFTTLDSEEETFSIPDAAHEPTIQPSLSDVSFPAEEILKGTEPSTQGDRPAEAQVESEFSKANQDLDSVRQADMAPLVSDSGVLPSVRQSAPAVLDSIDQFTVDDVIVQQIVEPPVTRAEPDESATTAGSSEEEKPNQTISVLDERSSSGTDVLGPSQEELANDVEPFIELSDLTAPDITNEQTRQVPTYRPLAPAAATAPTRVRRPTTQLHRDPNIGDLRLRLQLLFARGGNVELNLVADRRDQMPDEVEVSLTQGKLLLVRQQKDCYEPVSLSEENRALTDGVEWQGRADARHFRWMISRRELHVLAEGDVSGLYPFGSTARLQLNARHVVLVASSLRDDVLAALSEVGCTALETYDESTPGIPASWLLIPNVIPTHAVPMRDGADILNALCPLPDVTPHFIGGIHLERSTWLYGHPPQIRLTGDLSGVEIKIDGQPVIIGSDGSVSAPDWDAKGDHQLWFGSQTQTYSLRTIEEDWPLWPAIDFRMGATICGATVEATDTAQGANQVRVTATNPILVGARPGEVFHFHRRDDVCSQTFLTCISFQPVWALPSDPAHADRRNSRILLLQSAEPILPEDMQSVRSSRSRAQLQRWISMLNSASKKRLRIEPDNKDTAALWLRYQNLAKQLRRKLR